MSARVDTTARLTAEGRREPVCACGCLDPSYVCPRHLGTVDDPLYLFLAQPSEDAREDFEKEISRPDFQKPLEGLR